MTWKNETTGDRKTFDPHPEGAFAAVCSDVFEMDVQNPYHGQKDKFSGEIDNRATLRKVCVSFLTTEEIEIDGEMKPRYISFWSTKSWHEKSNLRKFIGGWWPQAAANEEFNEETLIGRAALVSVKQYTRKNGGVGASVSVAMPVPNGMTCPSVPKDFIRHKDKAKDGEERPTVTSDPSAKYGAAKPVQIPDNDDDMPF